jgi:hypothetical protein
MDCCVITSKFISHAKVIVILILQKDEFSLIMFVKMSDVYANLWNHKASQRHES